MQAPQLRPAPALLASAGLSLLFACAPNIETLEDDPSRDPEPEPCRIDPAAAVTLGAIGDGALLEGVLYVGATIHGTDTVALIELGPPTPTLAAWRPDLVGRGAWIASGPHRWARIRDGAIEVLDTTVRTAPVLTASRPLVGEMGDGFEGVYTFANEALFACLSADDDGASYLTGLSLDHPEAPPVRQIDVPCETFGARAAAEASLWIDWDPDGVVTLFDLARGQGIDSHSFATDGVHHYGYITAVATDGDLTATTVENDHYAFFYYARESPHIVYTSFGGGEKKLLEIAAGQALVAFPAGERTTIGSFAMVPPPAPEAPASRTAMSVDLVQSRPDPSALRVLGHDDERLIVTDGERLWDVPVGATGEVSPMVVTREGAPRCDD